MRFPPVERPDDVKRPLDSAPGQPDPVAVEPLERAVVVLHHHEQVIDVDLWIVFVDHPVPEIRVGGGYAYKLYGCGNITETIWARGWYASESRTTRSPARAIDELIAGPNAEIIDTY